MISMKFHNMFKGQIPIIIRKQQEKEAYLDV